MGNDEVREAYLYHLHEAHPAYRRDRQRLTELAEALLRALEPDPNTGKQVTSRTYSSPDWGGGDYILQTAEQAETNLSAAVDRFKRVEWPNAPSVDLAGLGSTKAAWQWQRLHWFGRARPVLFPYDDPSGRKWETVDGGHEEVDKMLGYLLGQRAYALIPLGPGITDDDVLRLLRDYREQEAKLHAAFPPPKKRRLTTRHDTSGVSWDRIPRGSKEEQILLAVTLFFERRTYTEIYEALHPDDQWIVKLRHLQEERSPLPSTDPKRRDLSTEIEGITKECITPPVQNLLTAAEEDPAHSIREYRR